MQGPGIGQAIADAGFPVEGLRVCFVNLDTQLGWHGIAKGAAFLGLEPCRGVTYSSEWVERLWPPGGLRVWMLATVQLPEYPAMSFARRASGLGRSRGAKVVADTCTIPARLRAVLLPCKRPTCHL